MRSGFTTLVNPATPVSVFPKPDPVPDGVFVAQHPPVPTLDDGWNPPQSKLRATLDRERATLEREAREAEQEATRRLVASWSGDYGYTPEQLDEWLGKDRVESIARHPSSTVTS